MRGPPLAPESRTLDPDPIVLVRAGKEITRAQFRKEQVALIPKGYSPWFHLLFPSAIGVGAAAFALSRLHEVTWLDLAIVPLVYLASNALEWRAHKHVLHERRRPLELLYDRHTPIHHRIYMTDDMSIRDRREWRLVLIPPFGILAILAMVLPGAWLLWHLDLGNAACFFLATTMLYVVTYEWLHLAYHLPESHPIARLGILRKMKHHHAVHHDPRLMQKWNFNVTVPLWDFIRGTVWREK
ncbi:hypothetical protein BH09MYX1_BH09MYX1_12120 [soil metagenome]